MREIGKGRRWRHFGLEIGRRRRRGKELEVGGEGGGELVEIGWYREGGMEKS